jgi:hypothetical protein
MRTHHFEGMLDRTCNEPGCGQPPEGPNHARCKDCGHPAHGYDQVQPAYDVRCSEVIGSDGHPMPEPVYCPCLDWGEVIKAVTGREKLYRASLPAPETDAAFLARFAGQMDTVRSMPAGSYAPIPSGDVLRLMRLARVETATGVQAVENVRSALRHAVQRTHDHRPYACSGCASVEQALA